MSVIATCIMVSYPTMCMYMPFSWLSDTCMHICSMFGEVDQLGEFLLEVQPLITCSY